MKSAPVILLVEIVSSELSGDRRMVERPPDALGQRARAIPLHLARIQARVLIPLTEFANQDVVFYSWIWASGSHGGPRLFHPTPGGSRVVFLRGEHGYLRTVGDYPAYDLEIPHALTSSLVDLWNSGQESGDSALQRLVALRIRTDFENRSFDPLSSKEWISSRIHSFEDLLRLVGPLFVAAQLEKACRSATNRAGRIAACSRLAWEFRSGCEAIRVWASALDREVREAACQLAATVWEARDIPECSSRDFR